MGRDQNHANRASVRYKRTKRTPKGRPPKPNQRGDAGRSSGCASRTPGLFFVCQTRAAAARKIRGATSHHQKKTRPGQTRTTPPGLASRACLCSTCAPVAAHGAFRFERTQNDKERPRIRVHTARTKKERRGRGGGAALLLEGGAERRRVPWYPSGTLRPGTCGLIKVATRPTGNQTREL